MHDGDVELRELQALLAFYCDSHQQKINVWASSNMSGEHNCPNSTFSAENYLREFSA